MTSQTWFSSCPPLLQAAMVHQCREGARMATWDVMSNADVEKLKARQLQKYQRPEGPDFEHTLIKEATKICGGCPIEAQKYCDRIKELDSSGDEISRKIMQSATRTSVQYDTNYGMKPKVLAGNPDGSAISPVDEDMETRTSYKM